MKVGRRPGLDTVRQLVSLRQGLYAILWATSGIAWWIAGVAGRRHFGVGSAVLYVGVATSLVVSLVATTKFPAPMLLPVPMLAVFTTTVLPSLDVPHGHDNVLFAVRTTVILTIAAGAASCRLRKSPLPTRLLGAVAAGNMILVAATIVGSQSLALLPSVQHKGKAIPVKTVTVQQRVLGKYDSPVEVVSHPMVEGSTAFVATEAGILHEIDLASDRITRELQLPQPEPSEVGLLGLVKDPKAASACQTSEAAITRLSADRLSVIYPFHAGIGTDYGWGESQGLRRIDVVVDLGTWKVAEWALAKESMPEEPASTYSASDWEVRCGNEYFSIMGPDVRTIVYTRGQVGWVRSTDEYIVAADTGGRVYVISVVPASPLRP